MGAGTRPRRYARCWRVPRLLLQPCRVFCRSPGVGDAAWLWGPWGPARRDDGSAAAAVPRVLPGLGYGADAVGAASEVRVRAAGGPVLVTSFPQRILENSNKIRNRLRYAAGLSCETCLP